MAVRHLYILSCTHIVLHNPAAMQDGQYRCGECKIYKNVAGVHIFEWHARCTKCSYGKWCGLSDSVAQSVAKAHGDRTGHHIVIAYEVNPVGRRELDRLYKNGILKKAR
jgi:hypothetical protein